MPNLLVPGIVQAIHQTNATCVYVCNVATERGETDHLDMSDHVYALERHIGQNVIDAVLANDRVNSDFTPPSGVEIVMAQPQARSSSVRVIATDLADDAEPWRHDSRKLGEAVMHLLKEPEPTSTSASR
jgi:uncharacterized cofD-like protein